VVVILLPEKPVYCAELMPDTLVAPTLSEPAQKMVDAWTVDWLSAVFSTEIVMAYSLVIAATDDDAVKAKFPTLAMCRRFWESILQGTMAEHVLAGRDELGEQVLQTAIAHGEPGSLTSDEVYLVGAGPADP
jgi:siroheme synthase (precorrin-2 oxidase/ferrochelatase)